MEDYDWDWGARRATLATDVYASLTRVQGLQARLVTASTDTGSTFVADVHQAIVGWDDLPEDPDDGGAGVREPLRPKGSPPVLTMEVDIPASLVVLACGRQAGKS